MALPWWQHHKYHLGYYYYYYNYQKNTTSEPAWWRQTCFFCPASIQRVCCWSIIKMSPLTTAGGGRIDALSQIEINEAIRRTSGPSADVMSERGWLYLHHRHHHQHQFICWEDLLSSGRQQSWFNATGKFRSYFALCFTQNRSRRSRTYL